MTRTKARWDPEELYLVAKTEIELISVESKSIVKELHKSFPHTSVEARKSLRTKKLLYKQILDELRATQTGESRLTEESNLNIEQPNQNRAPQENSNGNNGRILFWENNQSPELKLVRKVEFVI